MDKKCLMRCNKRHYVDRIDQNIRCYSHIFGCPASARRTLYPRSSAPTMVTDDKPRIPLIHQRADLCFDMLNTLSKNTQRIE